MMKIVDCNHEIYKNINYYKDYGTSYAYTDWVTFINYGDIINMYVLRQYYFMIIINLMITKNF